VNSLSSAQQLAALWVQIMLKAATFVHGCKPVAAATVVVCFRPHLSRRLPHGVVEAADNFGPLWQDCAKRPLGSTARGGGKQ